MLAERDPETARTLRPSDRLRIQRALEIFAATGQPAGFLPRRRQPGPLTACGSIKLFLAPDRDELRRRIDSRFLAMMEQGALDEVRALGERQS